jgi:poly-gamma-glutamate synthesis protein (capsule biosynthesis protein)
LNAAISDYAPRTGCTQTFVLVGGAENAAALKRAGFDAVSAATNHIKNCGRMDCGDRAFLETLDNLLLAGVQPIGAGRNHAEAMQPQVFTLNGVRFGIVSLGQIEPMAFAGEQTPGIAVLTPENLKAAIAAARRVSDVVIAMPHWGPEYVSTPNWIQRNLARQAVEYGADLVVGNHTHVVQAVQEIEGVPVFYGLGNFIFDQYWQPELRQSVLLQIQFEGRRYSGYKLIPVATDRDGRAYLVGPEEATQVLERIQQASEALE